MSENPNDRDEKTPPALIDPPALAPETGKADALSAEPVLSSDAPSSDAPSSDAPSSDAPSSDAPSSDVASSAPVATTAAAPAPSQPPVVQADPAAADLIVAPLPVLASSAESANATPFPATSPYSPTPLYQQPERVFVPPLPVAPTKKGNRGIGSLIAVLSVIIFALIYAIVAGMIIAVRAPGDAFTVSLRFLIDPVFLVPTILFAVGFVIIVLLVNRSGWWAHVLGSLFVAAVVYFGTIGFQLLTVGGFGLTSAEASARFFAYGANPFVVAAALVARETSLWIGAVIASRGRRMKTRNVAARAEFDRATAEHRAEYERAYAPVS